MAGTLASSSHQMVLNQRLPVLAERFPRARWLEIGWGDEGFYQAAEITSALTLRAIFWPTPSVLHVVSMWTGPERFFPDAEQQQICLTEAGMKNLQQFIAASFARDGDSILSLQPGIYGDSQFYRGIGDYYAFNTCNSWTAKALQSAGVPVGWGLFLTSGSVMSGLKDLPERFRCPAESLQ